MDRALVRLVRAGLLLPGPLLVVASGLVAVPIAAPDLESAGLAPFDLLLLAHCSAFSLPFGVWSVWLCLAIGDEPFPIEAGMGDGEQVGELLSDAPDDGLDDILTECVGV